ncbi:MAG: hypothetical protein JWQ18_2713 [Conexibacter sp.]|nr:hypothetical protein [Conexibacter sp.]
MSPQERAHLEAHALAERESQSMLGVPLERAFEMLEQGQLSGTAAEAELRMLRFVLEG